MEKGEQERWDRCETFAIDCEGTGGSGCHPTAVFKLSSNNAERFIQDASGGEAERGHYLSTEEGSEDVDVKGARQTDRNTVTPTDTDAQFKTRTDSAAE